MKGILESLVFIFGVVLFVGIVLPLVAVLGMTVFLNLISLMESIGWL